MLLKSPIGSSLTGAIVTVPGEFVGYSIGG